MKAHLCKQVVILGGGFAGLAAALRLARAPGFRRDFNVILIDQNCYHLYHGLLYEVATANYHIRPEDIAYLEGGVCIRLKSLGELVTKSNVDFMQATVTGVDRATQRISLAGQPDVPYDELIVALGSQPSFFNIPGLQEHAITLSTIPDALAIREKIRPLLDETGDRPRNIIVGGGGFTGVELAGEILHTIRRREQRGVFPIGSVTVTIVEAGPRLLGPLDEQTAEAARRRLASLGAKFEFTVPITQVTSSDIQLKDGRSLHYDAMLWTGGVAANSLVAKLGFAVGGRGQLVVEPTLRLQNETHVWAAGDCITMIDPATSKPVPQTAPQAMTAGMLVADNVVSSVHNQPLRSFTPVRKGFVIPIGGMFAIAQRPGGSVKGFFGWLIRKWTDFSYFRSIMSFRNAWKVFSRGARVYVKND